MKDIQLWHGNCLELMGNIESESVDLVISDSPYAILKDNAPVFRGHMKPIEREQEWDKFTIPQYYRLLLAFLKESYRVCRDGATLYCFCANELAFLVQMASRKTGWYWRMVNVWHKCLSEKTLLYAKTSQGEKIIDVRTLTRFSSPEDVCLWNGKQWTQVVNWELSDGDGVEIEFVSGEIVHCSNNHIWPTSRGLVVAAELNIGDIVDSTILPEPESPETPEYIPDDIGWFVGLYLAKGSMGKHGKVIQISGHEKEMERIDKLSQIVSKYGGTLRLHKGSEHGLNAHIYSKVLNSILEIYISGDVAHDKHLGQKCWMRGNRFLQFVLLGYLDGDGNWDVKNNRWRLNFTYNPHLGNSLRTICARLGYHIILRETVSTISGMKFRSMSGQIRLEKNNHPNNKNGSMIARIGKSRCKRFWDISVADSPNIFSLASGILTHNSNPAPVWSGNRPQAAVEIFCMVTKGKKNTWHVENGGLAHNHFEFPIPNGVTRIHPTQKPLKLIEELIRRSSNEGDLVLDPFMGSGVTMKACINLNRRGIGIEIDEGYYNSAKADIERYLP